MSFEYIKETCPIVDSIMDDATRAIKDKVTERFRDALIEACARITELEGEVQDLEGKLSDAESERDAANAALEELEREGA